MMEILTAVGTFGQFVVVLAAAAFALRQLRQLHRQNELQATLPFLAIQRSDAYFEAMAAVENAIANPPGPEFQWQDWQTAEHWRLRWMGNLFNEIGLLINAGLIDGNVVQGSYHHHIVRAWDALLPYTALRRTTGNYPALFTAFESLAVRARAVTIRFQDGNAFTRRSLPPNLREEFDRSQRAVLEFAEPAQPATSDE